MLMVTDLTVDGYRHLFLKHPTIRTVADSPFGASHPQQQFWLACLLLGVSRQQLPWYDCKAAVLSADCADTNKLYSNFIFLKRHLIY